MKVDLVIGLVLGSPRLCDQMTLTTNTLGTPWFVDFEAWLTPDNTDPSSLP